MTQHQIGDTYQIPAEYQILEINEMDMKQTMQMKHTSANVNPIISFYICKKKLQVPIQQLKVRSFVIPNGIDEFI